MTEEITATELKKQRKNYVLIDVREDSEFKEGHIANATNIPVSRFEWAERAGEVPKEKPVILYCLHGIRSKRVLRFLQQKGYKNVKHLQNGYAAWQEQDL